MPVHLGHDDIKTGTPAFKQHRQGIAAVALRLAGATYSEIAETLTFADADQARIAVESELANLGVQGEAREQLRNLESMRLERLLRSVWQKATDPTNPEHLAAVKVANSIVDRRIRLFGLDAPTEISIHTPTQSEIDAWVATVSASAHDQLAILEANVVEAPELASID